MGYLGIGQPGTARWNLKIKITFLQGTYQIPSCVFQYVAYKEGTCPNYASQTIMVDRVLVKGNESELLVYWSKTASYTILIISRFTN